MVAKPGISRRRRVTTLAAPNTTEKISNGAFTKLIGTVNAVQSVIKVSTSSNFPTAPNFRIKIDDELMMVTSGADSQLWTVIRGIENTIPVGHPNGSQVCQPITKGSFTRLVRGDILYSADTGSANALVVSMEPPIESYYSGLFIHVKVAHNNTGTTTINVDGKGAKVIHKNFNLPLVHDDLVTGQMISLIYDGTAFQLLSPTNNVTGSTGIITDTIPVNTNGLTDFTLSASFIAGTPKVFVNGLRQLVQIAYIEQGDNTISFIDPLIKGDSIVVDFEKV